MKHIGIDLGSRKSQICVRDADGAILLEQVVKTREIPEAVRSFAHSRVILETSSESFKIADQLRQQGHDVRVVPGTLVKQLGVGARNIKTDRRDAQVLSLVSCRIDLPSVHIRSTRARDIKSRLGMRQNLVEARTQLINSVRGYLRGELVSVGSGSLSTFCQRVRLALQKSSVGLADFVESQLVVIESLNEQISVANQAIESLASSCKVCCLLMTVPGVGPITSLYFTYAIDDLSRFTDAQQVGSYLGLTPGENSSSLRKRRTGITKAGPAPLRRMLCQAAWAMWTKDLRDRKRLGHSGAVSPLIVWTEQIAQRRGKQIAATALSRKLSAILYAIWRDEVPYDAQKSSYLGTGNWRMAS